MLTLRGPPFVFSKPKTISMALSPLALMQYVAGAFGARLCGAQVGLRAECWVLGAPPTRVTPLGLCSQAAITKAQLEVMRRQHLVRTVQVRPRAHWRCCCSCVWVTAQHTYNTTPGQPWNP